MPKFRKKPVIIDAVQLTPNSIREVEEFITGMRVVTETSISQEKWYEYCQIIKEQGGRKIRTLESHDADLLASFGDWIIKGVNGEFYPCKPDIFEKTYEEVAIDDATGN